MAHLPWLQGRELQEAASGAKSNRWHLPCCWLPFHFLPFRNAVHLAKDCGSRDLNAVSADPLSRSALLAIKIVRDRLSEETMRLGASRVLSISSFFLLKASRW